MLVVPEYTDRDDVRVRKLVAYTWDDAKGVM